jgi:hypothetical protein
MLVILTNEQLIAPEQVCGGCLLANAQGQPRWQQGVLACGKPSGSPARQYQCQMGFQVAEIQEP